MPIYKKTIYKVRISGSYSHSFWCNVKLPRFPRLPIYFFFLSSLARLSSLSFACTESLSLRLSCEGLDVKRSEKQATQRERAQRAERVYKSFWPLLKFFPTVGRSLTLETRADREPFAITIKSTFLSSSANFSDSRIKRIRRFTGNDIRDKFEKN